MGSRVSRAIPISILVGAFVIRLIFLLQTRNLPLYYHPVLDSDFFHDWANFKRQVGWLGASALFREGFYTYTLALLYSVFRESLTIARLAQCVIGSVTALIVYASAKRIYGLFAGVTAGVIFAFYGPAVFFTSEINETTLAVFLLMLSAYLLIRAGTSRPYLNSGLSGVLLGIAFLTRFYSVAALPAWAVHSLVSRDVRLKKATLVLVIGVLVPIACYQAFLFRGTEHAVFPTRTGWHAFLGSGATGGTDKLPGYTIALGGVQGAFSAFAASDRIDGQRDALRLAKIETGIEMSGAGAGRHWAQRAAEDLLSDPGRYIKTYFRKLGIFFGPSEPPANVDMRFVSRYSFLLRTHVFSFAVVAPIALVGLAAASRRESLCAGMVIPLYAAVVAAYLVSDSDKAIVVPFLSILAGGLIGIITVSLRNLRIAKAITLVIVVIVAGLLLDQLPKRDMNEAEHLVTLGDVYSAEAIFEKAEQSYNDAIRLSPDLVEAHLSLAELYGNSGKAQEGIDVLSAAMSGGLDDPRLRIEKASLLTMTARPAEAWEELEGIENSHPYEPRLHQLKGLSLLASGDVNGAVRELEQEVDYVGGGFITYFALGRAKLELEDFGEAARYLEMALALNPYNTQVAMQLADCYTRLEQHFKACDVLSRVLSVDPGNMPLRFKLANCFYRAGRPSDALKHFKELGKYDPANSDVFLNIGTVYAEMDSLERAIEMWEKALALDPDNEMARENLRTARE